MIVFIMMKNIHNYLELYEFVIDIKKRYHFDYDEVQIIDNLIFENFNKGNIKLLSSCYQSFNNYLEINKELTVVFEKHAFKIRWKDERDSLLKK